MSEFDTTPPPPPAVQPGSSEEKTWTLIMRLSPLAQLLAIPFAGIIAPLIVWFIKKDEMPALNEHGKEVLNFQITIAIAFCAAFIILFITVIGIFFIPFVLGAIGLYWLIMTIIGAIDASNGKFRRYPYTLRLIK